jgi:hypothetical protein
MNHLMLPLRRTFKKKRIDLVKAENSISLEEFIQKYKDHYTNDSVPPAVFSDLEEFRNFIRTVPDKYPMAHNSCIENTNGVCIHYMDGKHNCKAVLYGWRRE